MRTTLLGSLSNSEFLLAFYPLSRPIARGRFYTITHLACPYRLGIGLLSSQTARDASSMRQLNHGYPKELEYGVFEFEYDVGACGNFVTVKASEKRDHRLV